MGDSMKTRTYILGIAFILLFPVLEACHSSLAPFEPVINNNTDSFQLKTTAGKDVDTTLTYTWESSFQTANVNQACAITSGWATLVILDANGAQVYSNDLKANGTFATSAGATGSWTIRVNLVKFSGTLNFRVQRP